MTNVVEMVFKKHLHFCEYLLFRLKTLEDPEEQNIRIWLIKIRRR